MYDLASDHQTLSHLAIQVTSSMLLSLLMTSTLFYTLIRYAYTVDGNMLDAAAGAADTGEAAAGVQGKNTAAPSPWEGKKKRSKLTRQRQGTSLARSLAPLYEVMLPCQWSCLISIAGRFVADKVYILIGCNLPCCTLSASC